MLWISIALNICLLLAFVGLVQGVGGFKMLYYKIKNKGLPGVYNHRKNLFMKLPIEKGDIVFLGDSITEQGEWGELLDQKKVKKQRHFRRWYSRCYRSFETYYFRRTRSNIFNDWRQ